MFIYEILAYFLSDIIMHNKIWDLKLASISSRIRNKYFTCITKEHIGKWCQGNGARQNYAWPYFLPKKVE